MNWDRMVKVLVMFFINICLFSGAAPPPSVSGSTITTTPISTFTTGFTDVKMNFTTGSVGMSTGEWSVKPTKETPTPGIFTVASSVKPTSWREKKKVGEITTRISDIKSPSAESEIREQGNPELSTSANLQVKDPSTPRPSTASFTTEQELGTIHEDFSELSETDVKMLEEILDVVDQGKSDPPMTITFDKEYTPEEIAEYIFTTGDEKGISGAIGDLFNEGLVGSPEEAIKFLEDVELELKDLKSKYKEFLSSSNQNLSDSTTLFTADQISTNSSIG